MYNIDVIDGNDAFKEALDLLNENGNTVGPRGKKTLECLNVAIRIQNPYKSMITIRGASLSYYIAEMLWYKSMSRSTEFINKFSSFWTKLRGQNGLIVSNYGYWLFFNRIGDAVQSQFSYVLALLSLDKDSRQAVMHIKNTENSRINHKDIPCTNYVQFFIRENKLHMTVNMRSNDLVYGFTYDIFYFSLVQIKALEELKVIYPDLELGDYTHVANSLHIYEKDFNKVNSWIDNYHTTSGYDEDRALMVNLATSNYIPIARYTIERYENNGTTVRYNDVYSTNIVLALISKFRPLMKSEVACLPMMFRKVYENNKIT